MTIEDSNARAKAGACAYILHMLLQRMEATAPGTIQELLDGAQADQAASEQGGALPEPIREIFKETVALLTLANEQMKLASPGKFDA